MFFCKNDQRLETCYVAELPTSTQNNLSTAKSVFKVTGTSESQTSVKSGLSTGVYESSTSQPKGNVSSPSYLDFSTAATSLKTMAANANQITTPKIVNSTEVAKILTNDRYKCE